MRTKRKDYDELHTSDPTDFLIRKSVAQTEGWERSFIRFLENSARSNLNRSEEATLKQGEYKEFKAHADELKAKLTADIEKLVPELVASFKSIGINRTIKKYEKTLAEFNTLSEELHKYSLSGYPYEKTSRMDKLLHELACAYPLFIKYLPDVAFTKNFESLLPLSKLSAEDLKEIESNFKDKKIYNDPNFKRHYLKYFPSHIYNLDKIEDVIFALKLDGNAFTLLHKDGAQRRTMRENPNLLATAMYQSPEIIKYISAQELKAVAENHSAKLGRAINSCPEGLNNPAFTRDFFIKYPPKYVFSALSKKQTFANLQPYLDNFDGLREYYGLTSNDLMSV